MAYLVRVDDYDKSERFVEDNDPDISRVFETLFKQEYKDMDISSLSEDQLAKLSEPTITINASNLTDESVTSLKAGKGFTYNSNTMTITGNIGEAKKFLTKRLQLKSGDFDIKNGYAVRGREECLCDWDKHGQKRGNCGVRFSVWSYYEFVSFGILGCRWKLSDFCGHKDRKDIDRYIKITFDTERAFNDLDADGMEAVSKLKENGVTVQKVGVTEVRENVAHVLNILRNADSEKLRRHFEVLDKEKPIKGDITNSLCCGLTCCESRNGEKNEICCGNLLETNETSVEFHRHWWSDDGGEKWKKLKTALDSEDDDKYPVWYDSTNHAIHFKTHPWETQQQVEDRIVAKLRELKNKVGITIENDDIHNYPDWPFTENCALKDECFENLKFWNIFECGFLFFGLEIAPFRILSDAWRYLACEACEIPAEKRGNSWCSKCFDCVCPHGKE